MSHIDGDRAEEYQLLSTELVSAVPRRKTGVIVGVDARAFTTDQAGVLGHQLRERFPDVTLIVVAGAQSVAFEWEVDE